MSFDSFDYSCLKRISQAHPLDWPSELYNMISGPFAQESSIHTFADAWKLFERTESFFFSLTFRNNIQMPLIIASCNPILIEIQNHPIYMFYMSLITIILVFSQVFWNFWCLLLSVLKQFKWSLSESFQFWEDERIRRKGRCEGCGKWKAGMASKQQRKQNLEMKMNLCISCFCLSHYECVSYIHTQTGDLLARYVFKLAEMFMLGHQTCTNSALYNF